jgi:hypothetical protein
MGDKNPKDIKQRDKDKKRAKVKKPAEGQNASQDTKVKVGQI